jgi:hypothetical protein
MGSFQGGKIKTRSFVAHLKYKGLSNLSRALLLLRTERAHR